MNILGRRLTIVWVVSLGLFIIAALLEKAGFALMNNHSMVGLARATMGIATLLKVVANPCAKGLSTLFMSGVLAPRLLQFAANSGNRLAAPLVNDQEELHAPLWDACRLGTILTIAGEIVLRLMKIEVPYLPIITAGVLLAYAVVMATLTAVFRLLR